MTTASATSPSCYMSDTSKQDDFQNNSSPPTSLLSLDSTDPFEHSMSADTFLDSDFGSQGRSPAGSIHSSLYLDNQVLYQDYLILDLLAYGLPAIEVDAPLPTQMLPYPKSTPLITLGTGGHQVQTLDETPQLDVQTSLNVLAQRAPDAYLQSQAIKDWSGACSTALSTESAPSPNSSLPQESQHMRASASMDHPPPATSSHDWSTKNKLNLTVNTNMSAFNATDRLSPNCLNPLTPYSDSSASYVSPSAPSFYFEPQHSNHASHLAPTPPSIVNWLHTSINAPQSDPGVSYFGGLPTPSSATFSAVPTPTGMSFPTHCSHLPLKENPAMDFNVNQGRISLQPPIQSNALLSPTNIDLTYGLGYLPATGAIPQMSYGQYESSVNQFVNSPASYTSALDGQTDYFTRRPQLSSNTSNSPFDHASTFGHLISGPGFCGRFGQGPASIDSVSMAEPHSVPMSLNNSEHLNRSEQGKRGLSQHTDSEEYPAYKRRCSATSSNSANENVNPYQAGGLSSLIKRAPLVGSRLKPGPKSKSTLVQHPPPGANVIGLNPSREASGIPKDILKCLYDTICYPAESADGSIAKRYVCKLHGCGRSFPRKTAIESHIQTHLEDKPFICSVTNWYTISYTIHALLNEYPHILIILLFLLSPSNAAFVRQHDLRRHEKIHAKSKPFNCIW
ncbi:hypothetical protein PTTG_09727 [Puccinia triticina 1-1 BBBD Race 1]|uniref:C2H2-type domain-containing protein n=2 Tax=Puccinia triticina TaxID=208348 RepID=A0A0C4F959_PUCT1|nr:uncharacterized protein PtA15_10A73 [Puccinia triticina]OAV95446.1 hypothetical protein PTTG_09727 [Puccinia triticina 1-1 BBBD Race 1]WAQ88654.1 hypothetical protein PtA15_10A73 [Puccinia triticina]